MANLLTEMLKETTKVIQIISKKPNMLKLSEVAFSNEDPMARKAALGVLERVIAKVSDRKDQQKISTNFSHFSSGMAS